MKTTLIVGGRRGIGRELAAQLHQSGQHRVLITSRDYEAWQEHQDQPVQAPLDISNDASINAFVEQLYERTDHLDWLINCAGVLHNDLFQPEKTYKHFNKQRFEQSMQINCFGHLLLIKALAPMMLKAEQPLVASISARIGSIEDNQLGGWHAYRMSKAALNQGIKTLGIEWARKHPQARLMLLHPGTTDTDLSKPFQRNLPAGQLQTPEETARMLLEQMHHHLTTGASGAVFIDYRGQAIPW
jgi:NAD(P)-dependent dehydrogenase (short-subunit alcohol dehydrogenase family)